MSHLVEIPGKPYPQVWLNSDRIGWIGEEESGGYPGYVSYVGHSWLAGHFPTKEDARRGATGAFLSSKDQPYPARLHTLRDGMHTPRVNEHRIHLAKSEKCEATGGRHKLIVTRWGHNGAHVLSCTECRKPGSVFQFGPGTWILYAHPDLEHLLNTEGLLKEEPA